MGPFKRPGISRRSFALGSAAAAGAAVAAATLPGCDGGTERNTSGTGDPQVITDDSLIVSVTEEYENVDIDLSPQATWTLPLGTTLYHGGGSWAAAMMAPASASHVNTLGVLSLDSGSLPTLVEAPTQGGAFAFHDVRCSADVLAWVEMDYTAGSWALVAQHLESGSLSGDAIKLDEGDSDWDPPLFIVSGTSVIWYRMPSTSGASTSQASHCYRWVLGAASGTEIWESIGRFACRPHVTDGSTLTISPRVLNDEGTYYGITALDITGDSPSQVDQLVLPSGVRPFEAFYAGERFVFSIEATYNGVGSLGSMGTYIGVEGGPYIYVSREPRACAVAAGSKHFVKVQSSHFVLDTQEKTFGTLVSPSGSLDYGDYPASEGAVDRLLVYATLRDAKSAPESVCARVFAV